MPICTTCTTPTPYLYTVYESAHNLRLEQCSACQEFVDPYVEHDTLTLLLDLILLKRGVYRHLLFNRGAEPRRALRGSTGKEDSAVGEVLKLEKEVQRDKLRWLLVLRLGGALVLIDAFIRWTHLNPNQSAEASPWTREGSTTFLRTLVGCIAETIAFHSGICAACVVMLALVDRLRALRPASTPAPVSGIRQEFRLSLVPLSLLYSSLTKLFLLSLLAIWRPAHTPRANSRPSAAWAALALAALDDGALDREWVVRNVLGGMSAGFGLRVILDSHPAATTVVILAGWALKTAVATLVSGWVGGDARMGEVWLAYSIP